ncbi:Hypothetical predicted protein, partial [Olea europaea subsp. europaea]
MKSKSLTPFSPIRTRSPRSISLKTLPQIDSSTLGEWQIFVAFTAIPVEGVNPTPQNHNYNIVSTPYPTTCERGFDHKEVVGTEEADLSRIFSVPGSNVLNDSSKALDTNRGRSQLLETEYQNKILDDLFE